MTDCRFSLLEALPTTRVPKYQKHSSGQARVVINGKAFYLGRHGSKATKQRYDALIAEYLSSNRSPLFGIDASKMSLADLMVSDLKHAREPKESLPVSEDIVVATFSKCTQVVVDMIRVQLPCGWRPREKSAN